MTRIATTYGAAVAVLNNMHLIEYYIVDRNFNWIAMENHHGDLIAVGEFILTIAAHLTTAGDRAEKRNA